MNIIARQIAEDEELYADLIEKNGREASSCDECHFKKAYEKPRVLSEGLRELFQIIPQGPCNPPSPSGR